MKNLPKNDEIKEFDPPCQAIIYRAVKKRWVKQGQISHEVYLLDQVSYETYFLREDEKEKDGWETYVSCNLADQTPEHYALHECPYKNDFAKPTRRGAVVSLHTGRVRSLDLTVNTVEGSHIGIYGLPHPDQTNADKLLAAEGVARKLVAQSKWRWPLAPVQSHDESPTIKDSR